MVCANIYDVNYLLIGVKYFNQKSFLLLCKLHSYKLQFGKGETDGVRDVAPKQRHCVVVLDSTPHSCVKGCFLVSADLRIVCNCFHVNGWYASIFMRSDNPSATHSTQSPYKEVAIIVSGFFIYLFIFLQCLFLPHS